MLQLSLLGKVIVCFRSVTEQTSHLYLYYFIQS